MTVWGFIVLFLFSYYFWQKAFINIIDKLYLYAALPLVKGLVFKECQRQQCWEHGDGKKKAMQLKQH